MIILLFGLQAGRKNLRFLWFVFLLAVLLMLLLNEPLGVLVNLRYSLFLWIPLSLLVGMGIERMARFGLPVRGILLVIGLVGIFSILDTKLTNEYDLPIRYLPWEELTAITQNYEQTGDKLVFISLIEGDDWQGVHRERVMPHYFYGSAIEPFFIADTRNLPDDAFLREGQQLSVDAERLWLSYAPKLRSWRTGMFQEMLSDNGFVSCGNFADNEQLYLELYLHPRALEQHPHISFSSDGSNQVDLSLVQAVPEIVSDNFYLVHGWTLSDDFPRSVYSLALHVWDSSGNLVGQADYGLPTASFACTVSQISVEGLAAGTYQIRGFVYDWQTGNRIAMPQGQEDTILGEFQVQD